MTPTPCQYLCNPPNFIIVKSLLYKISNCVAILDNMIRRLLVMRLRAQAIWAVSFGAIRVPDWVILHIYTTTFKRPEPSSSVSSKRECSLPYTFTILPLLEKLPPVQKTLLHSGTQAWNYGRSPWLIQNSSGTGSFDTATVFYIMCRPKVIKR